MPLIITMPQSLLAYLWRGDCQPRLSDQYTWYFPCGLEIDDELVATKSPFWMLLAKAHDRHHQHAPDSTRPWSMILHVEEGENWRKETIECDCAIKDG